MSQNAKPVNAKRAAYAKKQEKEGTSVVMWIIGVLIVLGLFYAGWSIYMVS
jgi:cobalamin biosynthesis Mg chelatase CobN